MITIDLTSLENSNIKYVVNKYPDGQVDVTIKSLKNNNAENTPVLILSRLNNMEDLGLIIATTQALKTMWVKKIHLYTPYIVGLRSDRLFVEGGVRYVKDVIAPIINSQNYESVTCMDPHSSVAENCINNLISNDNVDLVKWSLRNIYGAKPKNNFTLISPDSNALKKIYKVAEAIEYNGDIITCTKSRDENGKLSKTSVPLGRNWNTEKDLIIIDDIIDGGRTFINIAKELRRNGIRSNIYLIMSHGIFSSGTKELAEYFTQIYCTNSYKDIVGDDLIKQKNLFY